ncbi:unnamed protein product [Nesidiocoris tenuis]|uniref:Uncharacterized protein n=1 Tax=Nesidiocoris tenuis TaxID=355587 RepID=A0A6H5FVZ0_9HEMI|nr:unnamed protein product [Nesidiocoris tenuis]
MNAAAAAAAPAAESKKEEKKKAESEAESDDDMGFANFDLTKFCRIGKMVTMVTLSINVTNGDYSRPLTIRLLAVGGGMSMETVIKFIVFNTDATSTNHSNAFPDPPPTSNWIVCGLLSETFTLDSDGRQRLLMGGNKSDWLIS